MTGPPQGLVVENGWSFTRVLSSSQDLWCPGACGTAGRQAPGEAGPAGPGGLSVDSSFATLPPRPENRRRENRRGAEA